MKEIFKYHPTIEDLKLNQNGTVIYYKDQVKEIYFSSANYTTGKKYPIIYINYKRIFVSRLVFETFICALPRNRVVSYLDGNHLNLSYTNLGPKKHNTEAYKGHLKKVAGYPDLFINSNGTYIVQFGLMLNIHIGSQSGDFSTIIFTGDKSKSIYVHRLVYSAWIGLIGNGKIIHRNGNVKDNFHHNLKKLGPKAYKKYINDRLETNRLTNICKTTKIPKADHSKIRKRLLRLESYPSIAKDYNTSDMSVFRLSKRLLTPEELEQLKERKKCMIPKKEHASIKKRFLCLESYSNIARDYNNNVQVINRLIKQLLTPEEMQTVAEAKKNRLKAKK